MVGRMCGGLHFLVEIELEMAKIPAFTNLKDVLYIKAWKMDYVTTNTL